MSFSVTDPRSGLEYRGSNLNTLFAQRRNLVRPSFLRLLTDIVRFNRAARAAGRARAPLAGRGSPPPDRVPRPRAAREDESIATFLERGHYSRAFVEQYLVPFGAAIWSADPATFTRFPMRSYARFMHNHGLLDAPGQARWRNDHRRFAALRRRADRALRRPGPALHARTQDRRRRPNTGPSTGVELLTDRGPEVFDRVIVATHSDQALRMIADPTPDRAFRSRRDPLSAEHGNLAHRRAVAADRAEGARELELHRSIRASRRATVTYWMNSLQAIDSSQPTPGDAQPCGLDRPAARAGRSSSISTPCSTQAAMRAQRRRHEIQGVRGILFAGAYWGYGFHEDGVQSGLEVARIISETIRQ